MKKTLFSILLQVCAFTSMSAQTYTDHLQQTPPPGSGIGTVKIIEDKSITDLINNQELKTVPTVQKVEKVQNVQKVEKVEKFSTLTSKPQTRTVDPDDEDNDIAVQAPAVDYSKKFLKNAIKIPGYRVQIFSGGNSRIDKNKAQQIGHQIKTHFPDQPVYVHFQSPHWICRMGNYRSQYEAQQYLQQVKSLGYPQAIIVKGKITVSR